MKPFDKALSSWLSGDALTDELRRQYGLLASDAPTRFIATVLAYSLTAAFLDWKLLLLLVVLNICSDVWSMYLMRRIDPNTQVWSYRLSLFLGFVSELAYILPAAMMWHIDNPFAKAFAVGMTVTGMMHVTTVRSVHLPVGLFGLGAIALLGFSSNTLFWLANDRPLFLLHSSLAFTVALGYGFGALLQVHQLHRKAAADRAKAQSANAAKSRFLAQISHELRTPLNAILGMGEAELFLAQQQDSKDRMGTLVSSARALATILDDILEVSALEEKVVPIRPVATAPLDVIESTVALFRPVFNTADLGLSIKADRRVPALALLDPQRLRQCLSNLLANALKFTDVGGVAVLVDYIPDVSAPRGVLRLDVIDTGSGISAQDLQKLFLPFQRGENAQSGSGLGLAISQGLARQMGGDLDLMPTQTGAHFRLTLRIEPVEQQPTLPSPPALDLSGHRILVVDDIATNRLVAATYLKFLHVTVEEAADGRAAVAAITQNSPDMVLLDMNMPGLSGLETLALIRALPGPPVPVLAMTADASARDRTLYLNAGLDGYIAKPLTPEAVSAALQDHLPKR